MTIDIIPFQTTWLMDFATLKIAVMHAAPNGSRIHHIGSTAVPGLAAKDIIDIQLTVTDLSSVKDTAFSSAGFDRVPGVVDHSPPSTVLDESELQKLFFRNRGRAANLHVRQAGRFNQRYALLCRDFLRTHPDAAAAYGLIKASLSTRVYDQASYYEIKDPVFDIIMAGANEWAARTAWTEPLGD